MTFVKVISSKLAHVHTPMVDGGSARGATRLFNMMRIEFSTPGEKMRNVTSTMTFTIVLLSASKTIRKYYIQAARVKAGGGRTEHAQKN